METYSPSHVTEDPTTVHNLHDDRAEVDYQLPGSEQKGVSLMRSKFSSDEHSNSLPTSKQTSDLRNRLNSRRKSEAGRSRSRSRSRQKYHRRRRSRSYSRSRRSRRYSRGRRSRSRSQSSSRSRSRSRRRSRSRNRSRRKSRSRSKDRRRSKKSSHYKDDNLDIEIRIKNESRSKTHEENITSTSASTMSKMYSKYTEEHHKKLAEFKKSLEEKFNVSVDSIVSGILDSKSASEIKDMLKVDIDKVSTKKSNDSASTSAFAKYEQCMHCGKLFHLTSPPGLCVKCHKPRDEKSLEAINAMNGSFYDQSRQPVAPPLGPFPYLSGQWPMMPTGPMPPIPPVAPGTFPPYPGPPNFTGMPPGSMPDLGTVINQPPNFNSPNMAMQYMQPQLLPAQPPAGYFNHTQSAQSSPLPAIRGHTLLPPGFAPPDHLLTLNQKSSPLDDKGSTSQHPIVVSDNDSKKDQDKISDEPETDIAGSDKSRPDPQSFDFEPGENTSQTGKNPADLLKTLVKRGY